MQQQQQQQQQQQSDYQAPQLAYMQATPSSIMMSPLPPTSPPSLPANPPPPHRVQQLMSHKQLIKQRSNFNQTPNSAGPYSQQSHSEQTQLNQQQQHLQPGGNSEENYMESGAM